MLDSLSFPRLDIWRQKSWTNKPVRFAPDYCIIARLKIVDKDFWIDGAVLAITEKTALFREVSLYLLKRQNEEVVLEIESNEYSGQIVSTDTHGYRLEFFEPLSEQVVADLCDRWRIDAA